MRKLVRTVVRVLAVSLALVAAVVVLGALFVNTQFGAGNVASLVGRLTDGRVSIEGLSGRVPDHLRARHFELRDAQGVWLTLDDVVLDWNPLPLLRNRFEIYRVEAARAHVLRLPVRDDSGPSYVFDIGMLRIPMIETDAPVSGRPAVLSVQGSLRYAGLMDWSADLKATRLDEPGSYRIAGQFVDGIADGLASLQERPLGLVGGLLGLSDIGPISAEAHATSGASTNAMSFQVHAGPLSATGSGTVDFARRIADMDFRADAPAMELRPDLKWQSLAAEGHFHGPFVRPDVTANVDVRALTAYGTSVGQIMAKVQGNTGDVRFSGSASGVMLPGDHGQLFARQPVGLEGRIDLAAARHPFNVTLTHPLVTVGAAGEAAAPISARLSIEARDLAPFARLEDIDLGGRAKIDVDLNSAANAYSIAARGTIDLLGESVLARLTGRDATFRSTVAISGTTATISDARFDAAKLTARLSGSFRNGMVDLHSSARLPDVSVLAPRLRGDLEFNLDALGPLLDARLSARGRGNLGTDGFPQQELTLTAEAKGLPMPQTGKFVVAGRFADAPVTVNGDVTHSDKQVFLVSLKQAEWKTLRASASISVPNATPVTGEGTVSVADLRDLSAFLAMPLEGSLQARVAFTDRNNTTNAAISAQAANISYEGTTAQMVTVEGAVADPFGNPSLDLYAAARGMKAAGFFGNVNAGLKGTLDALAVRLDADVMDGDGNPAEVAGAATADIRDKYVRLLSLHAKYRDENVSLTEPARIDFRDGLAVDRLVLATAGGRVSVAGRFTPTLATTIAAQNISAAVLTPFVLEWKPQGVLSGSAELSGTLAAPRGTIILEGKGLRSPVVPGVISSGTLTARAELAGDVASIDAQLTAGTAIQINVAGSLPTDMQREMALRVTGTTDLSVFNAVLSAEGRKVLGRVSLDTSVNGTFGAPRIAGHASLAGGEVQDIPHGFRVHDIAAEVDSDGVTARLTKLSGIAGDGAISGTGTMTFGECLPIDLVITARKARPLVSDRFAGIVDSDLRLTGDVQDQLTVSGNLNITRGEINLPDTYPQSVVVLDVRRRGQAPLPPQPARKPLRLNLRVTSPGQVFVRGRGIEAEVQGEMRITGTTEYPQVGGGLDLRRGTFSVAGQTLNFTRGRVSFTGASLRNEINPSLDLVAEKQSGNIDVQLAVTGAASEPRVQLSSAPSLPQDEILAALLFQQTTAQLSPIQLAEIAQAALSLTDSWRGLDPIGTVRKGLGLDRLAVGSAGTTGTDTQTTVTAGKYVARNIYLGATQGVGGGTQAEVQVDLSRNLKAIGTVNAGLPETTTQQARQHGTSTSFGLRYQFEY